MNTTVRVGEARDADTIFEILRAAFDLGARPEREAAARRLAERDFASFLLQEAQGRAVGVVRVAREELQVGRGVVVKGEVGHVGVRPELHGRGCGTALMRDAVRFMRDNGFHVSRLGGLMRFYSRFGYEPFPRRFVHIPVAPMDSCLKGTPWSELRALPEELARRVRRCDPARDHKAKHALVQRFNARRTGRTVMPEDPGPAPQSGPDPEGLEFVYEEDGALRGWIKGSVGRVHAADPAPSYRLDDLAVDCDCPEACEALLKTFIREAATIAPTRISARLPFDECLFAAITRANIAFEVVEMRQAPDGNMMQVVNLPALLEAIAPELGERLAAAGASPWQGVVRFELPREQGCLNVSAAGVSAQAPGSTPDLHVRTDHATFLRWVLGVCGFAEFVESFPDLAPAARLTLSLLFPRLPCASGPWG